MRSTRSGSAAAIALFFWSLACPPEVAQADDPNTVGNDIDVRKPVVSWSARAESRQDGVHVEIRRREHTPGEHRPGQTIPATSEGSAAMTNAPMTSASVAGSAPTGRTWADAWGVIHHETPDGILITLIPPPLIIGFQTVTTWERQGQDHPDSTPYIVTIDDRFTNIIWVPRSSGGPITFDPVIVDAPPPAAPLVTDPLVIDPLDLEELVLGIVPLPDIKLRMNPATGLVALAGWFWVDGYDGRPFGGAKTVGEGLGAVTIEVRVWVSRYEWSFGDGAKLVTTSIGKPFPQQSDIKHTYEYSSLEHAMGFPVDLTVQFEAEYRVNNGPRNRLAPIRRTYHADYPVQEVQTVLTGGPR